ncbi:MAG: hypothetical protein HQ500_06835 [Flavobacteriales bacterium]|nr:hypothetical protein [Flavobacteriales bacterium]
MRKALIHSAFLLALVLISTNALAQLPDVGNLYMSGKVINQRKRGIQSEIYLYKDSVRIDRFETNKIGRFEFFLPLQDSLAIVIYKDGYVSKTIHVDSRVPLERKNENYDFPFFIDLYQVDNVPANVDLERSVGKIIFAGTQFIFDYDFTKRQNKLLEEFVRERKEMKVRRIEEEKQ